MKACASCGKSHIPNGTKIADWGSMPVIANCALDRFGIDRIEVPNDLAFMPVSGTITLADGSVTTASGIIVATDSAHLIQ